MSVALAGGHDEFPASVDRAADGVLSTPGAGRRAHRLRIHRGRTRGHRPLGARPGEAHGAVPGEPAGRPGQPVRGAAEGGSSGPQRARLQHRLPRGRDGSAHRGGTPLLPAAPGPAGHGRARPPGATPPSPGAPGPAGPGTAPPPDADRPRSRPVVPAPPSPDGGRAGAMMRAPWSTLPRDSPEATPAGRGPA